MIDLGADFKIDALSKDIQDPIIFVTRSFQVFSLRDLLTNNHISRCS